MPLIEDSLCIGTVFKKGAFSLRLFGVLDQVQFQSPDEHQRREQLYPPADGTTSDDDVTATNDFHLDPDP